MVIRIINLPCKSLTVKGWCHVFYGVQLGVYTGSNKQQTITPHHENIYRQPSTLNPVQKYYQTTSKNTSNFPDRIDSNRLKFFIIKIRLINLLSSFEVACHESPTAIIIRQKQLFTWNCNFNSNFRMSKPTFVLLFSHLWYLSHLYSLENILHQPFDRLRFEWKSNSRQITQPIYSDGVFQWKWQGFSRAYAPTAVKLQIKQTFFHSPLRSHITMSPRSGWTNGHDELLI